MFWCYQGSKCLLKRGFFFSGVALLSGCGELNSQFTCPMKPGITCQSLDQVNTRVDQGQFAEAKDTKKGKEVKEVKEAKESKESKEAKSPTKNNFPLLAQTAPFRDSVPTTPVGDLTDSADSTHPGVTRTPEQVMRLWIAPYQDSQGNYFSSTRVYHVIQPGQWSFAFSPFSASSALSGFSTELTESVNESDADV